MVCVVLYVCTCAWYVHGVCLVCVWCVHVRVHVMDSTVCIVLSDILVDKVYRGGGGVCVCVHACVYGVCVCVCVCVCIQYVCVSV